MIWVALAGPASNFIQAILWAICFMVLVGTGINERFFLEMAQGRRAGQPGDVGLQPVSAAAAGRRPRAGGPAAARLAYSLSRIEPYGFFIVMGLVLAGVVSTYWLRPLMSLRLRLASTSCSRP